MKLRGIDFGYVLDASGARGWFGEGYSFHRLGRPIGLSFEGSTFVAKTTSLVARDPNRALRSDGMTPRVLGQHLVKINRRKSAILNALGLPGPGFKALLKQGRWQQIKEPFFLSFMATATDPAESIEEVRQFVRILKRELPKFAGRGKVGLQVNFSCPNVHPREHVTNFHRHLDEYKALDIPIMPKLSATTSVHDAIKIGEHPACDAICISNTIPWGEMADRIDWRGLFGDESPLKEYGGGGLSGAPLLEIVRDWIAKAQKLGLRVPINAGGGILKPTDVDVMIQAGASSVFVGSIAMLRPWNLQATIRRANKLFAREAVHEELETVPVLKRA